VKHYCTYFDHNYLARGLVLFRSLKRYSAEPVCFWVLALSDECERLLNHLKIEGVFIVPLRCMEAEYPELLTAKKNRSRVEYYFTCTPSLPLYILNRDPSVSEITYLDSDMCFFGDPSEIFQELASASVAITPHRFSSNLLENEKCGLFNVGWLTFRRDPQGLACLNLWQRQCLDWCYDRLEDGKYGDQKYLDAWPSLYSNLHVIDHPGVNAAVWNIGSALWGAVGEDITINSRSLLLFHFHGVRALTSDIYDVNWRPYGVKPSEVLIAVYRAYLNEWMEVRAFVEPLLKEHATQDLRKPQRPESWFRKWRHGLRSRLQAVTGRHFVVQGSKVVRVPSYS